MRHRGVYWTLIASFWFAAATMLIKAAGTEPPTAWVVFMRNAPALPVLLLLMRRKRMPFFSRNNVRLGLRAVLSILAMLCNFWALPRMPLANASLLAQSSPLFTVVWGVLFLDERLSRAAWVFAGAAFAGVYVTLRPTLAYDIAPSLMALAAGLLGSLSFATLKTLTDEEPPLRIVAWFVAAGTVIALPWALSSGWRPAPRDLLVMSSIAFTATMGQLFLTMGVEQTTVSKAGLITLVILVLNILGGWVFWNETPDPLTWVGCLMVAAGIAGLAREV